MSDLFVSWEQYHRNIEQLALQIYDSGWQFNQIVCLAKGGLRVGDILCRLFEQPLAILSTAAYGGEDNRVRGEVVISQCLSMTNEKLGNHVLLVDDLVDSGNSLQEALSWLDKHYGEAIAELKTAVIWQKACSTTQPDYFVQFLTDNPWIHQPFEIYERLSLPELHQHYLDQISLKRES